MKLFTHEYQESKQECRNYRFAQTDRACVRVRTCARNKDVGLTLSLSAVLLVFLASLVDFGRAENSVHILSKYGRNQLITSTTLKWVHEDYPQKDFSPNLVVGAHHYTQDESNEATQEKRKGEPVYICRSRHNGIWLVGSLTAAGQKCVVVLLGRIFSYEKYELLKNVDEAARLSWVRWDRFSGVTTGAVSTGERETYVARRRIDKETEETESDSNMPSLVPEAESSAVYLLGKLDTREGLGRISFINQTGQEEHRVDGEILVEIEPVYYELTIKKFNQRRKQASRQPRILGTATLTNEVNQVASKVDSVIAYDTNYSLYWGQGQSILVGLPTTIILPNGTVFEKIKWGIQEAELRKEVFRIEAVLEPNTGVNVTVKGNFTDSSVPYSGELVAIYGDKVTRSRQIQGTRKEISMQDVVADYSPAYFLHNHTLVPTTTTTTTTAMPTTSTAAPTVEDLTTTSRKPKKNETRRNENSAMLSDESDALSLKKTEKLNSEKADAGKASTLSFSLLQMIFFSLTIFSCNAVML